MKKYYTRTLRSQIVLSLFLAFTVATTVSGQIAYTGNYTPQQLVTDLLSTPQISISNVQFHGDSTQLGYFINGNSNLPIDTGLVLSDGNVHTMTGPNNTSSASSYVNSTADVTSLMDSIFNTSEPWNDGAILEFDFTSTQDSIDFNFAFAGEEYDEYVCSIFSDGAVILLSGPGISGPYMGAKNIAVVPGTNVPICINSVNNGFSGIYSQDSICTGLDSSWHDNSQYFIDNQNNTDPNSTQFDGFTTKLEAKSAITPGETYHVKMVIADESDQTYDSDLLIETKHYINYDCMNYLANVGSPCNDGLYFTSNDSITPNCNCKGDTSMSLLTFSIQPTIPYVTLGAPISAPTITNISPVLVSSAHVELYWLNSVSNDSTFLDSYDIGNIGQNENFTLPPFDNYPLDGTVYDFSYSYVITSVNGDSLQEGQKFYRQYYGYFNSSISNLIIHNLQDTVYISNSGFSFTSDYFIYNNNPDEFQQLNINQFWSSDSVLDNQDNQINTQHLYYFYPGQTDSLTINTIYPAFLSQPYYYLFTKASAEDYQGNVSDGSPVRVVCKVSDPTGLNSIESESEYYVTIKDGHELRIHSGNIDSGDREIIMLNSVGKELFDKRVQMNSNDEIELRIPTVASGIYFIKIEGRHGSLYTQKVMLN